MDAGFEIPGRRIMIPVLCFSVGVIVLLAWLLYYKEPVQAYSDRFLFLPSLNAAFNAVTVLFLVSGYRAIRRGQREQHRRFMLSALFSSACFLVGYLIHHYLHGDTPFQGTGFVRPVYISILITHIALAALLLPAIPTVVYFALSEKFPSHKHIARIVLPMWLYVSATGVVVYLMLEFFTKH
jgi:putative membrane protein